MSRARGGDIHTINSTPGGHMFQARSVYQSIIISVCALLVTSACDPPKKEIASPSEAEEAMGFPVANVAEARVLEVKKGDDALYAKVEEAQWTFWIKTTGLSIKEGDHLLLGTGKELRQHEAAGIDEPFERVIDITQIKIVTPEESKRYISLSPPENGHAIADVYTKREALSGKPIAVRGRIVKANKNIFDTNWYHLQDGTGEEGTNDLTITSTLDANVGDVVVARADLSTDHSLGFGYDYEAILLDAKVTIESKNALAPNTPPDESAIPRELIEESVKKDSTSLPWKPIPEKEDAKAAQKPRDWNALRAARIANKPHVDRPLGDLTLLGLKLGASTDPDIAAWLDARGVVCEGKRRERRETFVYDCTEGLSATNLPEREDVGGALTRLLLAHADDAPLGLISITHKYSDPKVAIESIATRRALLDARLGEPSEANEATPKRLSEAKIARHATTWRYEDVTVDITLFKMRDTIRVTERWDLNSDARRHKQRPGAKPIHGAMKSTPNPHVGKD